VCGLALTVSASSRAFPDIGIDSLTHTCKLVICLVRNLRNVTDKSVCIVLKMSVLCIQKDWIVVLFVTEQSEHY